MGIIFNLILCRFLLCLIKYYYTLYQISPLKPSFRISKTTDPGVTTFL
jgi:hypothetical protein